MGQFHGEFASADASALSEAASRFALYVAGTVTPITLASTEYVVIHDVIVDYTGSTARAISVYSGADAAIDAGEKITETSLAQNGHSESNPTIPATCIVGTYPKVKTSGAGQVTVLIRGTIY